MQNASLIVRLECEREDEELYYFFYFLLAFATSGICFVSFVLVMTAAKAWITVRRRTTSPNYIPVDLPECRITNPKTESVSLSSSNASLNSIDRRNSLRDDYVVLPEYYLDPNQQSLNQNQHSNVTYRPGIGVKSNQASHRSSMVAEFFTEALGNPEVFRSNSIHYSDERLKTKMDDGSGSFTEQLHNVFKITASVAASNPRRASNSSIQHDQMTSHPGGYYSRRRTSILSSSRDQFDINRRRKTVGFSPTLEDPD